MTSLEHVSRLCISFVEVGQLYSKDCLPRLHLAVLAW
jgi:hypothetical protein